MGNNWFDLSVNHFYTDVIELVSWVDKVETITQKGWGNFNNKICKIGIMRTYTCNFYTISCWRICWKTFVTFTEKQNIINDGEFCWKPCPKCGYYRNGLMRSANSIIKWKLKNCFFLWANPIECNGNAYFIYNYNLYLFLPQHFYINYQKGKIPDKVEWKNSIFKLLYLFSSDKSIAAQYWKIFYFF